MLNAVLRLKQAVLLGNAVVDLLEESGQVFRMNPVQPLVQLIGEVRLSQKAQLLAERVGEPGFILRRFQGVAVQFDVERALGGHIVYGRVPLEHMVQLHLAFVLVVDIHKNADELDGPALLVALHIARRPVPAVAPIPRFQTVLQIIFGSARGVRQRLNKQLQGPVLVLRMEQIGPGFQPVREVLHTVIANHMAEIVGPIGRRHLIARTDIHIPQTGGYGLIHQMYIVAFPLNPLMVQRQHPVELRLQPVGMGQLQAGWNLLHICKHVKGNIPQGIYGLFVAVREHYAPSFLISTVLAYWRFSMYMRVKKRCAAIPKLGDSFGAPSQPFLPVARENCFLY